MNAVVIRVIRVRYEMIKDGCALQAHKYSPGWMDGWVDGWMGGWMDGRKSRFKDCLQQSKI